MTNQAAPYRSWDAFEFVSKNQQRLLANHRLREQKLHDPGTYLACTGTSEVRANFQMKQLEHYRKVPIKKDSFRVNDGASHLLGSTEYRDTYSNNRTPLEEAKQKKITFTINPRYDVMQGSDGRPIGKALTTPVATQYSSTHKWPK